MPRNNDVRTNTQEAELPPVILQPGQYTAPADNDNSNEPRGGEWPLQSEGGLSSAINRLMEDDLPAELAPVTVGGPRVLNTRAQAQYKAQQDRAQVTIELTKHPGFIPTIRVDKRKQMRMLQVIFGPGMNTDPKAFVEIPDGSIYMVTRNFPARQMQAGQVMLLPIEIAGKVLHERSYNPANREEIKAWKRLQADMVNENMRREQDNRRRQQSTEPFIDQSPDPFLRSEDARQHISLPRSA